MGPPKAVRGISQEAFDELVKENMEDLDMDPTEALQDAIQTLSLQGVDLSGHFHNIILFATYKTNTCLLTILNMKIEIEFFFFFRYRDS